MKGWIEILDEKETYAENETAQNEMSQENEANNETVSSETPSDGVSDEKAHNAEGELDDISVLLAEKDVQARDHIDRIQRLQADFENYKKRIAREREQMVHQSENRVYLKILPLFDSLNRAFGAYNDQADSDAFIEGISKIYAQFEDLLNIAEISVIDALGKPFNPVQHEALLSVEADEPPNTILEEFERGYLRSNEILRPSRVKVSKKRETPVQEETPGEDSNERGEA
jgi:molecular chaperone GrpE